MEGSKTLSDLECRESYINVIDDTKYCHFPVFCFSCFPFLVIPYFRTPMIRTLMVLRRGSPQCSLYKLRRSLINTMVLTLQQMVFSSNLYVTGVNTKTKTKKRGVTPDQYIRGSRIVHGFKVYLKRVFLSSTRRIWYSKRVYLILIIS